MLNIFPSSEEQKEYVHKQLQAYNSNYMKGFSDFSCHMEENGAIVAGIVAESVGDTVEVEFLFVDESCRGRGLGQTLLEHVEAEARKQGMRRVLLNTYSFQAPGFYEKMGYRAVFKLEPAFDEFFQSYFLKEL
ncbi:MAG: GNAT family N-acetyltransferase [Oscillospiraceae bacterium]